MPHVVKNLLANVGDARDSGDARDVGSTPGSGRCLREGNGKPLQYFLHGKLHGWRNLVGYSPQGSKKVGHD